MISDKDLEQSTSNGGLSDKKRGREHVELHELVVSQGDGDDDGGPEPEYPTKSRLMIITTALCLAVFLMALDQSIVATAIPRITDQFNSLDDVGWYGSAYLLTTAALQLQFGKFYTFLDIKWTFLTAIGIFELGSLLCGVARNSTMLIVGRAIAGCGSAGIYSGALLILANSVPIAKRATYIGLIGGMYGISSIAGPLLGGLFTDKVSWRWCFYINLPVGAITIVLTTFFFPKSRQHKPPAERFLQRVNRFDPVGSMLFMPGIICLLLALQWGGTLYPWNNGRVIALFVLAGALLIAFAAVQSWRQEYATIPPRILNKRSVWASALFAFGIGGSFYIAVYYLPIWFQAIEGASAVESGIRILPMMLSAVLLVMIVGALVTALGQYVQFMILGTVFMSVGAGLFSTWTPASAENVWLGYQVIFGIGVGLCLQQPLIAVQAVLDIKDVAVGASLVVFAQSIGAAIFVSVGEAILENQLVAQLTVNAPSVDPTIVLAKGATGFRDAFPADVLPAIILSYNNALTTIFLVGAAIAASTIVSGLLVEWKSVKAGKIEAAAG